MPKSIKSDAYLKALPVISEVRLEKKITQIELANRMGKPQSFISKVERGERRLDIVEFCALAEALSVSPTSLLKRVLAAVR